MIYSRQRLRMTVVSGCLASIGIALLLGTAVWSAHAQERQGAPTSAATTRVTSEVPTGGKEVEDQPALQLRNPRYQLSKDDAFDLTFPFTPEFNQTVTVHPDGFVTLTGVGDLYVAGKTIPQLRELLQTAYATILHDPVFNVVLKDFEKPYFIAGGQVARPGKYDLRADTTLTEAVAIAGGFTESSKHSQVLLFRRVSNDWAEAKVLDVKKMFQAGNLSEDLHLEPGDMFFVPQNRISKVKKWIPYTAISTGFSPTGSF